MAQSGPLLNVKLTNVTANVNAISIYVLGKDPNPPYRGDPVFLKSDGKTLYYPPNPSGDGAPLGEDCAIPLGSPNESVEIAIPRYLDGARIYMCLNDKLEFFLNHGKDGKPGVAEPSLTNISDKNISKLWDFCEFAYNEREVYANISYVDLVCIPVALALTTTDNATQTVLGMDGTGLNKVAQGLLDLTGEGQPPWDKLIINDSTTKKPFRIISPNQYVTGIDGSSFQNYFDDYITTVWDHYKTNDLTINLGDAGNAIGRVGEDEKLSLTMNGKSETFNKPTTFDILSCSTGPFDSAGASDFRKGLLAPLAAAFNRTVYLLSTITPNGTGPDQYYKSDPTNHYSNLVHEANLDKRGYGFPYDDVVPKDNTDISGFVRGKPKLMTVLIGGGGSF